MITDFTRTTCLQFESSQCCEFSGEVCSQKYKNGLQSGAIDRVFKRCFCVATGATKVVNPASLSTETGGLTIPTVKEILICGCGTLGDDQAGFDVVYGGVVYSVESRGRLSLANPCNGFPPGLIAVTSTGTNDASFCILIGGTST